MKAQTPAKGISKIAEYPDDSIVYRIECECTNDDCSVDNWIELVPDSEVKSISLQWYATIKNKYWQGNRWTQIKNGLKLIFTGYIEMEHDMIVNEQTALNWCEAIRRSIDDLKDE